MTDLFVIKLDKETGARLNGAYTWAAAAFDHRIEVAAGSAGQVLLPPTRFGGFPPVRNGLGFRSTAAAMMLSSGR
ncbi:MAG: hypothetical protein IPI34_06695 [bacterium]|nr:hypothetical protein [bacterium]